MGKVEKIPVEVPADFIAAAERAVAGGEFVSVEQVVASALRSWQAQREADLAKLRSLIDEGLASPVEAWDGVGPIVKARRRLFAS